jgi:hypothetical protein
MPLYIIRFFVYAAVYSGATLAWLASVAGFAGLGILAAGIVLAGGAAAAWIAAVIIGRQIPTIGVRFIVHVLATVLIFLALSALILFLLDFDASHENDIVRGFTIIVAVAAIADGALAAWRERVVSGAN